MKLSNTTRFDSRFLRRMTLWCARQVELPPSAIRSIRFTNTRHRFRGRAWESMDILIRIGDDKSFPYTHRYRARAPEYTLADPIEAMVSLVAHECEHLCEYRERRRTDEVACEHWAFTTLERFRHSREELLSAWNPCDSRRTSNPAGTNGIPSLSER